MLPLGALKAVVASASKEKTDEEPSIVSMTLQSCVDSRISEGL